jgi:glyoxylase-like metal-dependent hydrolase (beta-lactamase superfamily II)
MPTPGVIYCQQVRGRAGEGSTGVDARGEQGRKSMLLSRPMSSLRAPLSRRQFLASAAGAAVLGLAPRRLLAAAAPHSFKHGDFEVIVVSDGYIVAPADFHAQEVPPAEREAFFMQMGLDLKELRGEVNLTLIRVGDDLILFDTGGVGFQPTLGTIEESLRAAGISPADITRVVFSHGHPDHIWGTALADNRLRFPNAAYYSGALEWDFWNSPEIFNMLPSEMHGMATESRRHYAAVEDRVTMVKPGDDIVTGIRVLDMPGHTPGHLAFEIEGGDGLIIVADTVIREDIYFAHPEWKFGFDAIHEQAVASRKALLDRAATDKTLMLGYHWAYPGLGYAEREGQGGFVFVPAT